MRVFLLAFHKEVDLKAGIIRIDLITDNDLYHIRRRDDPLGRRRGGAPPRRSIHAIDLHGDDPIGRVQKMAVDVESRVVRPGRASRSIT